MARFALGFVIGLLAWGILRSRVFSHDDERDFFVPNPDPDEVELVAANEFGEWHFRGHLTDQYPYSNMWGTYN